MSFIGIISSKIKKKKNNTVLKKDPLTYSRDTCDFYNFFRSSSFKVLVVKKNARLMLKKKSFWENVMEEFVIFFMKDLFEIFFYCPNYLFFMEWFIIMKFVVRETRIERLRTFFVQIENSLKFEFRKEKNLEFNQIHDE